MPISFKKPSAQYVGYDPKLPTGMFPDFFLEMDVDDSIPLDSLLQGCSIEEVKLTVNSKYATISNGKLTAIKNTQGAKGIPSSDKNTYDDYIVLYAESTDGNMIGVFVRIYDKPTGFSLCTDVHEIFIKPEDFDTLSKDNQTIINQNFLTFKLLESDGLEVKPGGAFNLYYKVYPATAHQALRFRSNSGPMQENIDKMTFSDELVGETCWTGVEVSKDAKFFAGNPGFKESEQYGTYLMPKRGGIGTGKPEKEVQLQIVEYDAGDPKPLDYLATTLPVQFKNSVGGRIGTIDGGLRIYRDATGRSLVKDVYKWFPPELLKRYAKAVVLEMTTNGVKVMKPGIDYTYHYDAARNTYCLYEPDLTKEQSIYKDIHGYAVAVHPYGKKMTWSDQKGAVDYSLSDAWKDASKYYYQSNVSCFNTSGFLLTSHYHFYNNSVPKNKGVNPVRCLKDYHYKWPGLLYTGTDSNGSDVVSYWILPSAKECKMMDMGGHWALIRALDDRINYAGGELTSPSRFWTSSLVKKDPALVEYASWTRDYAMTTAYAQKDDEYDVRPFHRF